MKYQIGDTVLVLHTNEEGKIIEFINRDMALVEIRGVRFPVYMDQIDFPYFKRFTEKKAAPPPAKKKVYADQIKKEKPLTVDRNAEGVWISLLPLFDVDEFGDEYVTKIKIYLLNKNPETYTFSYNVVYNNVPEFTLENTIHNYSEFYLHDIEFSEFNDNPVFEFEFSLLPPVKNKAEYYETHLKLKAKQLFNKIAELQQKGEATFTYKLLDTYPDRQEEVKMDFSKLTGKGYKVYDIKDARQHLPPARSVIDLHAEKLTDDYPYMSNAEILNLQLQTFETYYELAIAHHQPELIVIHGIGDGTLRNEIHSILKLKKEVKSFVNRYHPSFGDGATEIFFSV